MKVAVQSAVEFGSVCSGIEAASVAWHPLGWRAAWLAEIDKFACAALAHHYPDIPNLGDMATIADRVISGTVPAPDVFCGGTPCQAFSVAGLRNSLDDARGNLTLKFVEIANAIDHVRTGSGKPECIVVWENVPGVLSTKDNAFGCFLGGLAGEDGPLEPPGGKWANAGAVYGPRRAVAWRTLDAQYFGVAQRRRRVLVVASAREGFDPATVLFEWDGMRRDTAPRREAGKDVAGSAGESFGIRSANTSSNGWGIQRELTHTLDTASPQIVAQPVAHGGNRTSGAPDVSPALLAQPGSGYKNDFESETFLLQPTHTLRGEGFDASEDGTGRGTPLVPVAYATKLHNTSSNQAGKFYENYTASLDASSPPPAIVFDTTQITSAANRSNPQPGDACHPLAAGAHAPAIAFHPTQDPISSTDGTTHCMGTGNSQGGATIAVAHVQVMPTMTAGGPSDSSHNQVSGQMRDAYMVPTTTMQVRRLTPEECEALQGFPRGYTAIPWRTFQEANRKGISYETLLNQRGMKLRGPSVEECPDGPRYKALGNSWAVPKFTWLGRRIDRALRAMPNPQQSVGQQCPIDSACALCAGVDN